MSSESTYSKGWMHGCCFPELMWLAKTETNNNKNKQTKKQNKNPIYSITASPTSRTVDPLARLRGIVK